MESRDAREYCEAFEKRFFDRRETGLRSWLEEKLLLRLLKLEWKGDVGEVSVGDAYCLMGVIGGDEVSMIAAYSTADVVRVSREVGGFGYYVNSS